MVLITCIFIHLSLCHNISPIVPITCIFYLIFYLLWCNQCIIEDIRKALSFWSEMHTLSQKDLKLLYYAYDLLSVKVCSFGPYLLFQACYKVHLFIRIFKIQGDTKNHVKIYEIMLKCINLKNDDDGLKDWCLMLWKSRRLSHTMCGSPICDVFLKKCKWSTDVDIWKCYMEEIHEVGFEHKLNISSHVPYYQDPAIGTSIKQVKEVSTKLIKRV